MQLTQAQQAAVTNRGGSLLISAAAGSGKTRVLTERILGYLADGADIDQFLIITYTNAAAAEMRGRIAECLRERMLAEPGNDHWQRQYSRLPLANISTIHAYCQRLLREKAALCDIGADFRLCDEQEQSQNAARVLEQVIDDCYVDYDADFQALLANTEDVYTDGQLAEWIQRLYSHAVTHPSPRQWLTIQAEADYPSLDRVPWAQALVRRAAKHLALCIQELEEALDELNTDEELYAKYIKVFTCDLDYARAMREAAEEGWDALRDLALAYSPMTLRGSGKEEGAELEALCRPIRERWKTLRKTIAADLSQCADDCMAQVRDTQPIVRGLCRAALRYHEALDKDMRQLNALSFNNLEHLTLDLLTTADGTPSEAAHEISGRFIEICVDEVQDISALQERLITALSRNGTNIFWVGDVRQSIYRFRLAEPQLLIDKYNSYIDADIAQEGQPRRILLNANFRSRAPIIDLVNTVFAQIMSADAGEMDYTPREYLEAGATWPDNLPPNKPQVVLFDKDTPGDDENDEPEHKLLAEARWVAKTIADLCRRQVPIACGTNEARPITPGDCAILCRVLSGGVQEIFEFALRCEGIPYRVKGRENLFDSPEALVLLSYLSVLNSPSEDVALIAVLRSRLYRCSAEDLVALRAYAPNGSFYDALVASANEETPWSQASRDIERLRFLAPDLGVGRLVWTLFELTNMLSLYAAQPDGAHRQRNLMLMLDLAQGFEAQGRGGLFAFVCYLRRLAEQGYGIDTADSSPDAVSIYSIHSAKGLEFPYVFLTDTDHKFNDDDTKKPLLIHAELGMGLRIIDAERTARTTGDAHRSIQRRLKDELTAEAQRLLYVALTRACQQLYITATVSNADERRNAMLSPRSPLPLSRLWAASRLHFFDWLEAALAGRPDLCTVRLGDDDQLEEPDAPAVELSPVSTDAPSDVLLESTLTALSFVYPHTRAVTLPSKATATGLRGLWSDEELTEDTLVPQPLLFERPQFAREARGLTAGERGSAVHVALQHAALAACTDKAGCIAELKRLVAQGKLTQQQRDALSPTLLLNFAQSDIAQRIQQSDTVWREKKFSLLVAADTVTNQPQDNDELILLQGVIDCCFREPDGWVVVDYKTDAVRLGDELEHSQRYRAQLEAYALALARITGQQVTDALLYYTATNTSVSLLHSPQA